MPTFVTDFDGTITREDFYRLIIDECRPANGAGHWARYVAGEITHFDALNLTFAEAPVGEERLLELIERMRPDPALAEGIELLDRAGWKVVIVSAGCRWYIDRILKAAGVLDKVEVHSNDGGLVDGALVMRRPVDSPFASHDTGIDKSAVVRHWIETGETVAFAGNGPPDLAPALVVAPSLRFARADLADALDRIGEPYRPFDFWIETARALTSPTSGDA